MIACGCVVLPLRFIILVCPKIVVLEGKELKRGYDSLLGKTD
jgi:hypothetical protein